jgi:general secretion pathway protein C
MSKLYTTILNLAALFILLYVGVDLFYRVVRAQLTQEDSRQIALEHTPEVKRHKRPPLNDFKVITDRNLFGSLESASEGVKAEELENLEPTSLKIALLGTVTGDQQSAVAVIEETDKRKQGLYKVGDSIQNAVLKMILRGKVVLRVDDKDEILTMEESAKRASAEEARKPRTASRRGFSRLPRRAATITVRRTDIEKYLSNINTVLSQVRIRPHFEDGEANGLALSNIKANSIFAKLGLRDGDIVKGVDNRPITSPDDILSFYKSLKSGSEMSLQIDRRGRERTINYRIR